VYIVLKFQVDRACFHAGEAGATSGGRVEEKERKNRASTVTIECLRSNNAN